jgi:hypothetical protein
MPEITVLPLVTDVPIEQPEEPGLESTDPYAAAFVAAFRKARMVPLADLARRGVPPEYTIAGPHIVGLVRAVRGEAMPTPPFHIGFYGGRTFLVRRLFTAPPQPEPQPAPVVRVGSADRPKASRLRYRGGGPA